LTPLPTSIRRLLEDDLEDFLPLAAGYQKFYSGRQVSRPANRRFFRKFVASDDRGLVLGGFIDGRLVGFATLYWTFSSVAATEVALLNDLYVEQTSRRKGVARSLLAASVEEAAARGFTRIDWLTEKRNESAQALYDAVADHRSEWVEYSIVLKN